MDMTLPQFFEFVGNFFEAARQEDVSKIQSLTAERLHVQYEHLIDNDGGSALHVAASEGRTTVCKFLLDVLKFDINKADYKGNTPLYEASWRGHWPATEFLISRGADVTRSNNYGATLLHSAAMHGNANLLKHVLNQNVNPNSISPVFSSPLLLSITSGSIKCMELLLEAGAKPDEYCPHLKTPPLCLAASSQNKEMIKCLLKHRANPNVLDNTGMKAIECAAMVGFQEGVELLFPDTLRIERYPDWSINGIMKHVRSKEAKELRKLKKKELFEQGMEEGTKAFRSQNYMDAMIWYTQAIDADGTFAKVFSNRSLCWIRLNRGEAALADAKKCVELRPRWAKSHFREGAAQMVLFEFKKAAEAFAKALSLEPHDTEIQQAYRSAQEKLIPEWLQRK